MSTPFLDALVRARGEVKEDYFFPGHHLGKNMPREMVDVYGKDNEVFNLDLPELDGLGNIHSEHGGMQEEGLAVALSQAASFFKAYRTWFLVNGSTGGILTALFAIKQVHQKRLYKYNKRNKHNKYNTRSVLLLGRDSHKSAFDALQLADIDAAILPVQTDPEFGVPLGVGVVGEELWQTLDRAFSGLCLSQDQDDVAAVNVCGVLLTRPSYQGVGASAGECNDHKIK